MLALALLYTKWASVPLVSAVVTGVGAAGAGLFLATAVKLGRPLAGNWAALLLVVAIFVAVAIARASLLFVMPVAVAIGLLLARKGLL